MIFEYLKELGYDVIQDDKDKTVMVYKHGKPFFRYSWRKQLSEEDLKKHEKMILDKAIELVLQDAYKDIFLGSETDHKHSDLKLN